MRCRRVTHELVIDATHIDRVLLGVSAALWLPATPQGYYAHKYDAFLCAARRARVLAIRCRSALGPLPIWSVPPWGDDTS
eukprot:3133103-Pleurochrysis_carterae.AAC.2